MPELVTAISAVSPHYRSALLQAVVTRVGQTADDQIQQNHNLVIQAELLKVLGECINDPGSVPVEWLDSRGNKDGLRVFGNPLHHEDEAPPVNNLHAEVSRVNCMTIKPYMRCIRYDRTSMDGSVRTRKYPKAYLGQSAGGGHEVSISIHRLLCFYRGGVPRDDRNVAGHLCDKPECCNPFHLEWMTISDNLHMARKRRKAKPPNRKRTYVYD